MANNKDLSVMINDTKLNIRVGAIIKYQNKLLVERNKNVDFSVIPGGRIQTLETSLEALIRELNEELGIDLSNEKFELASLIENYFNFDNKKYHELYFVYKVELNENYNLNDGIKNLDNSDSSYYFLNPEELEKEKMRENIARVLNVDISQINIKATTEEGLGFTGEGLGISAQSICLLETVNNYDYRDNYNVDEMARGCAGCSGCAMNREKE